MAFPVPEATAESAVATAGTSHLVALPAGITSTDGVLILMDIGSTAATLNALTDWAEVLDENLANGLKILWYTGTGVPSNPTFTSSASTRSAHITYRISNVDRSVLPSIATTASGTSATPDPPQISAPANSDDYLFITFFGMAGEEADDDTWANTPPTSYTPSPPLQKSCGTAGTNLGGLIAAASRQLNTGAVQNPGTFGVDVSAAWRAQTIRIAPLPPPSAKWRDGAIAAGSGVTSVNVVKPSGQVTDDITSVVLYTDAYKEMTPPDANWYRVAGSLPTDSNHWQLWLKRITGSEPTWTFSWTGATNVRTAASAAFDIPNTVPLANIVSSIDVLAGTSQTAGNCLLHLKSFTDRPLTIWTVRLVDATCSFGPSGFTGRVMNLSTGIASRGETATGRVTTVGGSWSASDTYFIVAYTIGNHATPYRPVRHFDGTNDRLDQGVGAVSGMTYGTMAVIVQRESGSTGFRTILGGHTSGGVGRLQLYVGSGQLGIWDGSNASDGPTINDSNWYLVVVRKATGTATPRFSVYNIDTDAWSHAAGNASMPNWTSIGVGGTVEFEWESVPERWAGRVAVRGIWTNDLPWSADTTGDAAIEAAGLEVGLQEWLDAGVDALWAYNQAIRQQPSNDITAGGANEVSRTITAVPGDGPDFDYTYSTGTTFNRTPVDSAGVADARSQVQTVARSRVDSAGATDPIARSGTADRSRVDPTGLADPSSYQKILAMLLGPDLARPQDAVARVAAQARSHADPSGSTDTLTRASASSRSRVDVAGLADVAARVSSLARSRTDPAGASDLVARAHTAARSRTDGAGLDDAMSYEIVGVLARTISDSAGMTDAISRLANMSRSRVDSAGESDTVARVQTWPRTFTDSGGLADVLSKALASARSRVDSAGASDSFSYAVISLIARSISDPSNPDDALARMVAAARTRTESLGLGSVIARASAVARAATDAAGLSDVFARAATYARARAEDVGLDDLLSYVSMQLIFRSPVDPVGLRDNASRAVQYERMVSTPTGASDAVNRGVTLLRAAAEDIQTTDTLGIAASYVRQAFDAAGLTDFLIISTRLPGVPNPTVAELGVIVDGVVFITNVAGYADLVGGAGGTSTLSPGEVTSELEP